MNKEKLIIPVSIVISGLILGGFVYGAQLNKQESIERQQQVKIEEAREAAEIVAVQEAEEAEKEYIADRKKDCLEIYEVENEKWGNTKRWRYSKNTDTCVIQYTDKEPKSDTQCDENYPVGGDYGFSYLSKNSLCKSELFETSF